MRKLLSAALAAATLSLAGTALAQPAPRPVAQPVDDTHGPHDSLPPVRPGAQPFPRIGGPGSGPPRPGQLPPGLHAPSPHGAPGGEHGPDAEGAEHGEHHAQPFNFAYGLLGEKEGVEPSLAWRKPGMPVPFLANLINFGILAFLMVKFGRKPLADGLAKRKTDLMREIDEAAKVKAEATARLEEYQAKIARLDQEATRIRTDYAEQAKRDEERILREAKEKRERMRRDAEFLLVQESKALRGELLEDAVAKATVAAETLVKSKMTAQDQERLAEEYLSQVTWATKARGAA